MERGKWLEREMCKGCPLCKPLLIWSGLISFWGFNEKSICRDIIPPPGSTTIKLLLVFFYCYYIYTLGFGIRFEIFLLVASEHLLATIKIQTTVVRWEYQLWYNTFSFWRLAKRAARATLPLLHKNDQTLEMRTAKGKKTVLPWFGETSCFVF